jgi:hypothetical protein
VALIPTQGEVVEVFAALGRNAIIWHRIQGNLPLDAAASVTHKIQLPAMKQKARRCG